MDRHRLMMIVAVLTGVAVLALGFLLGVQPQLAATAEARSQQEGVDAQNDALRATTAQLRAESERLPELTTELDARRGSVPSAADMPTLLRQLDEMATGAGVTVSGFTTADAVAYVAPEAPVASGTDAAAPAEGTPAEGAEGGSTDGTATDGATADAAEPTAPPVVTDPLVTTADFSSIAVTVDVQGSFAQALEFVDRLQKGDRLFLVTSITSSDDEEADAGVGAQTWTVGGLVYVMTDTSATGGSTTPVAPAQAGTDDAVTETASGR